MNRNCSIVSSSDGSCCCVARVQVTMVTSLAVAVFSKVNVAACLQTNMRSSKACRYLGTCRQATKAICRCPMSCCDGDGSRLQTFATAFHVKASEVLSHQEGKVYKLRYIKILKSSSFAISEAPDNQSTNRLLLLPALPGDLQTLS